MTDLNRDGVLVVGAELPLCPRCGAPLEMTPSYALLCRERGSEHIRIEQAGWRWATSDDPR